MEKRRSWALRAGLGALALATTAGAADLEALAREYEILTDPFEVAARDYRTEMGSPLMRTPDGGTRPRWPGERPYVVRERRRLELEQLLEAANRLPPPPPPPDPGFERRLERMLQEPDPASKWWLDRKRESR